MGGSISTAATSINVVVTQATTGAVGKLTVLVSSTSGTLFRVWQTRAEYDAAKFNATNGITFNNTASASKTVTPSAMKVVQGITVARGSGGTAFALTTNSDCEVNRGLVFVKASAATPAKWNIQSTGF